MSERGGGGFGWWLAGCRGAEGARAAVFSAPGLLSASCTPSVEWVSSATLVDGDRVGGVQHQKPVQKYHQWATSRPVCRCFNGPTPLSVVRPSQYPTIPPLHFSPHNCIRICPMPSLCLMPISEGFMELSPPLLPLKCGLRGSSTLYMDIFASEDVTSPTSGFEPMAFGKNLAFF